jgi:predicted Rossmann fold nucleotide-binding protein DprA/Smf involved in DNA uptake
VPGRITSPVSTGTNALLARGAVVVRGPEDALELVSGSAADRAAVDRGAVNGSAEQPARGVRAPLPPRLRDVLERVGAGCDTPERLRCEGSDVQSLLRALSELELLGLLVRGDGGRYLVTPCAPV